MGSTIDNPELVIGLVGPIGVNLDAIIEFLQKSLLAVQYDSKVIHLTSIMRDLMPHGAVDESTYSTKYRDLIKNADELRRKVENKAALACLAISEIRRLRQVARTSSDSIADKDAANRPLLGMAYIVRQFKRDEEIALLRQVYGRKFIQVSVYLDKDERRSLLVAKIRNYSTGSVPEAEAESQAISLIDTDYNESKDEFGQRVGDVFHLGDIFVRGENKSSSAETIDRFVRAFFGDNGVSPTKAEYGMYAAAGAALRSLDLSRQVGSAIFSVRGEVITMGCNEVPKAFGGTYWSDDPVEKHRDYEEGQDGNHQRKLRIVHDLIERMGDLGMLSGKLLGAGSVSEQVRTLMTEQSISGSNVMDIIEFGRIIHAEMSAITDAARIGRSLDGAILYCTTFPCHMCAKHIVAAGISKVVFLEPYPKSHAKDLHADSITFSPFEQDKKVLFEPFIGISPRRYRDIFEKTKRKDSSGRASRWNLGKPVPRVEDRSSVYIDNEEPAISLVTRRVLELSGS